MSRERFLSGSKATGQDNGSDSRPKRPALSHGKTTKIRNFPSCERNIFISVHSMLLWREVACRFNVANTALSGSVGGVMFVAD